MKPLSRTHCQVEDTTHRLYPTNSPMWYKKSDGTFDNIDLTFNDTTSTIGDISLMDKGIASVGKRKGNNPNKIVGVRPDGTQHLGTQQLEFSLINVELDEESQDFNVETDLEIILENSRINQLVKLNKPFRNCKIEFDIYTKGIELQNNKYTSTTKIADYGFNLTNIGENIGNTTLGLHNNYSRLNKDIPYFDFNVGKITDKYITMGQYSKEEEFGDSDLSSYIVNEDMYDGGSAVCYENSIIFTVQSYNIENYEDVIINNLCDNYGLEVFDDGGIGQYLTKDKKKVIGYYAADNVFFGFINTNNISDEIKALFKRKSFKDTSFLNISLSEFCTDMVNRFNKDLFIEVNNNYYEPINNEFDFKISEKSYYICNPVAFDSDYNRLNYYTTHTLTDNEDGSYRYTKYLKPESSLNVNTAQYLDADLALDQSASGVIDHEHYASTLSNFATIKKTSGNFNSKRNATSGTRVDTANTNFILGDEARLAIQSSQSGASYKHYYNYWQTHHIFDTSGISGTVSDADFKMRGKFLGSAGSMSGAVAPTDIEIIILESTWDGSSSANTWNDFDGFTSNWDADDVTEYSSNVNFSNTSYDDLTTALNSTAKTDIQNNSTFKIALIDYEQYYLNSFDNTYNIRNTGASTARRTLQVYSYNSTNDAYKPYIEYTASAPSAPVNNATFFGTNF